jgi:tRNA modification GTPase
VQLFDIDDTIVAISSAPGPAVRGVVRLSGPEAWDIAASEFEADPGSSFGALPNQLTGRRRVEGLRLPLDMGITFWPGSRTYTGQPLAELHTVGSPPLLELLVADCLRLGARLAERGEFTLRAFLSGRLDLTQAEAVLGVVAAETTCQLDVALEQLAGGVARPTRALRDRLLDLIAHLEAGLDFVDEADVDPLARAELASELLRAAADVEQIDRQLCGRERPDALARVVLAGPPNAGKSRLFNVLVGEARALVSPRAGTTRDYLSAKWPCGGRLVELIDTAGEEPARTEIERQAQAHRAGQAAAADLVLECRSIDTQGMPVSNDRPHLRVWTKCDVAPAPDVDFIATSAETGAGIDELRSAIAQDLDARAGLASPFLNTGPRCRDSLHGAAAALRGAASCIAAGGGDELVAIDLRSAADELGKVVGAVVTDDILDRIFSRFCIGK